MVIHLPRTERVPSSLSGLSVCRPPEVMLHILFNLWCDVWWSAHRYQAEQQTLDVSNVSKFDSCPGHNLKTVRFEVSMCNPPGPQLAKACSLSSMEAYRL